MLFALNKVNICKFANDTTLYVCYSNLKSVLEKLEHNSELATTSFEIDYMKLNTVKCNLMVLGNKNDYMWEKLDQDIVWESNDLKLLEVTIDNNIRFDKHVSNITRKQEAKCLNKSSYVRSFKKKRRILFKAFIESQFT